MNIVFTLPLFHDHETFLQQRLEKASVIKGRSPASLIGELDAFTDRVMKNLDSVDRKAPMAGYSEAFEASLVKSIKTTRKSARTLLRGFFFEWWQILHLRAYTDYPHLPQPEKCRTAFLPESDVGAIAASNKDDPLRDFRPEKRPPPARSGMHPHLWYDGAGSGMHFDEEPDGFFPVDYGAMLHAVGRTARNVPDAVEMLEKLSPNWARANVILVDREKRSARIDKCSFNRFAVRLNTRPCIEHISGMVCFDATYKAYQKSLREEYLASVKGTWAGYEGAAWDSNDLKDRVLDDGLRKIEKNPTYDGLLKLLTCHERPGYLCKHGDPVQEGEPVAREYTLERKFHLIEKKELHRWQWDAEKNIPTCQAPREVYPFEMFAS